MKISWAYLWLFLSALCGGVQAMQVQKVESDGLTALLSADHTVPVVALRMVFMGGKRLVAPGDEGVGELAAMTMLEGAGGYDAEGLANKMVELGASISMDNERDGFSVSITTVADAVDEAVLLAVTMLREAHFHEDDIERGKAQMIAGLKRRMVDPQSLAFTALARTAFQGLSQGRTQTETSLEGLNADKVRAFVAEQIQSQKLMISLAGAITKADAERIVRNLAQTLPMGVPFQSDGPHLMQAEGLRLLVPQAVPQTTVVMAYPGLMRDDPDFMAAYVMNHILGGGGFSSRLTKEIREERGLAYSAASFLSPTQETATLMVYFATRNDAVLEAYDVARQVLEEVATNGVTEEELRAAKNNIIGSYPLRFDANGKIAQHLMGIQISKLPMNYHEVRNDLVAEIQIDDIKAVAARLLLDKIPLMVAAGNPDEKTFQPDRMISSDDLVRLNP